MTGIDALKEAVSRAGGQVQLAKTLGLKSQGSISNWIHRNRRVPPRHVLPIEAATGISRHDLRPDLYPREARQKRGVLQASS